MKTHAVQNPNTLENKTEQNKHYVFIRTVMKKISVFGTKPVVSCWELGIEEKNLLVLCLNDSINIHFKDSKESASKTGITAGSHIFCDNFMEAIKWVESKSVFWQNVTEQILHTKLSPWLKIDKNTILQTISFVKHQCLVFVMNCYEFPWC